MEKITFPQLFTYTDENNITKDINIVIPMIQRDYAQGRSSAKNIRKSFVQTLHKALSSNTELNLDFIYGSYEEVGNNKAFIPLDGQQRLTTLFLLYWLISKREHKNETDEYAFLGRFTYQTRQSTRAFCDFLGNFKPQFEQSLSHEIKEDPQFILLWENDPTVRGMLVMLDELNDTFYGDGPDFEYWNNLNNITFFFADLNELGISDEIYIKMNSRGKPLTPFEHFKVELDKVVADSNFSEKVDTIWTDLFWKIRQENDSELPIVDDCFLNYIHFVADIICLKESGEDEPADHFEMLQKVFMNKQNQKLLEKALDVWTNVDADKFFEDLFTEDQPTDKTLHVNIRQSVNIFKTISRGEGKNMRTILLLWSCVLYLMNQDKISQGEFRRRIRILRNLSYNSEYEFRKERYSTIVNETEQLILFGTINTESNSFNQQQKIEEINKLEWLSDKDTEHEINLSSLENNNLLLGSTCLIGTDNYDYFDTFNSIFNVSNDEQKWIEVTRALLTYGDISYRENSWRVLIPGKTSFIWRNYFGPNTHENFRNRATTAISALLRDINNGNTLEEIITSWLDRQEKFDWRYYMIKYHNIIEKSQYGKYWFTFDDEKKTCHFYIMHTPRSTGGRHWEAILYVLSQEDGWSIGNYADDLLLSGTNYFISNEAHSFKLKQITDNDSTEESENIPNDETKTDTIDRVKYIRDFMNKHKDTILSHTIS